MILDGRLRYHRAGLEVPVALSCKGQKPMDAFLVNLSQGGMQIHTTNPIESAAAKSMQVSFELPGARSALKAKAEVAWQDKRGNLGIRFIKLAPQQQRTLKLWLAQQYFAN
jgi:c-di-GMP-binding flagellar brake protein YcgR